MRDPSVAMPPMRYPSWVIWVDPVTLGGLTGKDRNTRPAAINSAAKAATAQGQRLLRLRDASATGVAAVIFPELVSRFHLFRAARISAALWHRMSRSFSRDLLMRCSSSGGRSAFNRTGGVGDLLKMALKIAAEVSPRNGNAPVAIS